MLSITLSTIDMDDAVDILTCWWHQRNPVPEMLQLKLFLQHYCFGGATNLQRDLKLARDGLVGLNYGARSLSRQIHSKRLY